MAEKEFKVGVVVGKFMPFHDGHDFLIATAKARCEKIYVVIAHKDDQDPDVEIREEWIRTYHPDVEIRRIDATKLPDWNSILWAKLTIEAIDGIKPDAAFSSEAYGEVWCYYMGCKNVVVDQERKKFPVSGTEVRADPMAMLDQLPPIVANYYIETYGKESHQEMQARLAQKK